MSVTSTTTTTAPAAPVPGTSVAPSAAPMGKPVSGRTWKKTEKARFSTVRYKGTKVLSSSWEEKMLKRAKHKEMKALQSEIKTRRQGERDAKRQAREEKEKRRKENELKSASVQVVRLCVLAFLLMRMCVCMALSRMCACDLTQQTCPSERLQISRTHRMKTMSKKQLRNIKKTIVNKQGVVEYVPIYSK